MSTITIDVDVDLARILDQLPESAIVDAAREISAAAIMEDSDLLASLLTDGRTDDAAHLLEQIVRPKFASVEDCQRRYREAMAGRA